MALPAPGDHDQLMRVAIAAQCATPTAPISLPPSRSELLLSLVKFSFQT